MCAVYAWMCCSNVTKDKETQEAYYLKLSEEMIDNLLDANLVTIRRKIGDRTQNVTTIPNPLIVENGRPKDSTGIHVTKIRRSKGGKNSSHTTQRRCVNFSRKTKNQCSECEPTYAVFSGRTGIYCFVIHYEEEHE